MERMGATSTRVRVRDWGGLGKVDASGLKLFDQDLRKYCRQI